MITPVNNYEITRNLITSAKDPWEEKPKDMALRKMTEMSLSHIIAEIYLGGFVQFVETAGIQCITDKDVRLNGENPNCFKKVITLCPFERMKVPIQDSERIKFETVEGKLKDSGVEWAYLGRSLHDDETSWVELVYNTTFPSNLKDYDFNILRKTPESKRTPLPLKMLCLKKVKKMEFDKLTVEEWFEPSFKKLDETLESHSKTLVHCFGGVSRSVSFLCAYLIKRYRVTADQAVRYVRSKRYCTNPKCIVDLRKYARALGIDEADTDVKAPAPAN